MNAPLVAVLLSLVSAVAYAVAAVTQARLAARGSGAGALRLLGSGAWWGAVTLNAAAALLHVVALKYGPLTVVQPLGALTLVAAVPLGARMAGRPVSTVEWRGTALTLAGLATILATASGPAPDDVLSVPEALAVAGGTATLIGLLSWPGARPGLRHATASGVASGVASALTRTVTVAATDRTGPVLDVRVIGVALLVAVFAAGGLLLAQTAYRGGLGAPLATVTLANPLAAAVIGLGLLGEHLRGGAPGVALALFGAALASWGVVLLSRATEGASVPAEGVGERLRGAASTPPVEVRALVPAGTGTSGVVRLPAPAVVGGPPSAPSPSAGAAVTTPARAVEGAPLGVTPAAEGAALRPAVPSPGPPAATARRPGRRRRRHRCPGRGAGERRAA
ncbi:integral membrane protein [Streptomyces gancidicus BKS 13-15]|uniref:Integral membrane protein n=2 Tax=Streptomyces pseudogriseolus TaxID=36817 RepID=M3ECR1_STREZ|nr:hypothetical protein [Streptomyces gancidicus]EMF30871.1 integral membrane protein [Streptomyces gancidicus BKS 13-15]